MTVQMGTFSQFTTARLGIYASQASLSVTGNNIANINTKGYTRQRMDLVSLYPTGEARYANNYNLSIGYGVLCDSVSQLRDPFLDIRYRNENANLGAYEAKLNGLNQISHILDEVGKGEEGFGVIEDQLGDFIEQLQGWNNLTGIEEYDNLVRSSASQLCSLFNVAAKDLQEVYENQEKYLEQNVSKANRLLNEIRGLNEQIRAHNIYGDNALELRDARNVAIDELSSLMKIDVTYSMEKIDQFTEVEKLTITLPGTIDPALSKAEAMEQAEADNIKNLTAAAKAAYDAETDPAKKAEMLTKQANYDADYKIKTWKDYNVSSNFDKPIKLIDGIYGTQINLKKDYVLNPDYNAKYMTKDGVATDDINEAQMNAGQPVRNPDHQGQYMLKGYDPNDAASPKGPYGNGTTDDINEAAQDPANQTVIKNDKYQGKYLDPYKQPTDDIGAADFQYDEKYLMDIDPLVDQRGKYMRDSQYGVQLRESIDLKDNDLYGAIQSMRELLTEEGEFSSDYELGRNLDEIKDPEERARAELIADPQANVKRGIPYYMKTLDNLAQQFARELNKLNQPDQYGVGVNADNQPVWGPELTLDMIYQMKPYEPKEGEVADYSLVYQTGTAPLVGGGEQVTFLNENGDHIWVDTYGPDKLNPVEMTRINPASVQFANLTQPGVYTDLDGKEVNVTQADIDRAKYYLEALKTGANSTDSAAGNMAVGPAAYLTDRPSYFVDKDENVIKNVDGGGMTLDDVKYSNLDPLTLHDDFKQPMNGPDGQPLAGDALKAAQMEAQTKAIQKAQENLELLRDANNRTDEWNFYKGGALLSNSNNNNDPTGITAANISVSQDWGTGAVRVLHSIQPNEITYDADGNKTIHPHSTAGDNITHMISSLKGQREFYTTDIDADSAATRFYFRGSFQEMFTSISGTLGEDTNETTSLYNRYDLETLNLENDRQSISGVDLNEEATSMMQFQKSFSAACQLLTIIDSMLDKLINGTI